jgi:transcriptional regulator with XRE-family HTH domain
MSHHGELLKKLVRRKKLTQDQASDALGFSRDKLNRLFRKETIDEVTREEIEKIFQVPPSYFPAMPLAAPTSPPGDISCWQQLAEARQEIINLQRQIIAMSTPNINAPVRTKGQPA